MKIVQALAALVFACNASAATIAIDSGHTPLSPGATAACGQREVVFNDTIVQLLKAELEQAGHRVVLTRQPGQNVVQHDLHDGSGRESAVSLRQRLVHTQGTDLLLSIHHDSIQERYLQVVPDLCGGRPGTRFTQEFITDPRVRVGYNVFTYTERSKTLALAIGKRLKFQGLQASYYHSSLWEPDPATAVDEYFGVWRKNLFVLRESKMPAVLIEVWPIVDPAHEQRARDPAFQQLVVKAIRKGVDDYVRAPQGSGR
jgi:N-acetylmuramoyl-L-alanine amidase